MIAEIVRRAQAGEEAAFAELFAQRRKAVYRLCLGMTHNHEHAEDLVQETFLQVHLKIGTFRGGSTFSTWLHRIAFNQTMMSLRRKGLPCVGLEDVGPEVLARPDDPTLGIALRAAIHGLPHGQKQVLLLKYVDGMEHSEIAERNGYSVGCSKSQCSKAAHRVRTALGRPH